MTEILAAASPLETLRPPRALEELSGRIDQVAPTALHQYARLWDKSVPEDAFNVYVRDSWQRSILFLDILRQRGNQHEEMLAHGVSSVLIYDSELVMRGDELPNPVNYSLVRSSRRRASRSTTASAPSSSSIRVPDKVRVSAASSTSARSATRSGPGTPSTSPALLPRPWRDSGSRTSLGPLPSFLRRSRNCTPKPSESPLCSAIARPGGTR